MSASASEGASWSNAQWTWRIFLACAVQVVLVLAVFDPSADPLQPPPPPRFAPIRLLSETTIERRLKQPSLSSEPTLFALVHPRGFSGSAWLKSPQFPHKMTNALASPRWLSPSPADLVDELSRFVQTNDVRGFALSEKPTMTLAEVFVPQQRSVIEPALRIEGDLAKRRLVSTQSLPAPDPEILLTNCVVMVIVNEQGDTLSPVLRVSSGSPKADERALQFAKAARFAPLREQGTATGAEPSRFMSGTLIFQWLAGLQATNAPALAK